MITSNKPAPPKAFTQCRFAVSKHLRTEAGTSPYRRFLHATTMPINMMMSAGIIQYWNVVPKIVNRSISQWITPIPESSGSIRQRQEAERHQDGCAPHQRNRKEPSIVCHEGSVRAAACAQP